MKQSARQPRASRRDALVTGLYVAAGVVLLLVVASRRDSPTCRRPRADAAGVPVAASSASPSPSTSPSATLTTTVTRDVTVHRGQYAASSTAPTTRPAGR